MKAGYWIYFNEKPYFIIPINEERPTLSNNISSVIESRNPAESMILNTITDLDSSKAAAVIIYAADPGQTFEWFKKRFTLIQAGGGFVSNEKEEYLFIFRRGKWDLPKGKLDDNESIAECALREVEEETGLQDIELLNQLCNTYHVYHEKGKIILKESVWFNMTCQSGQSLTPQMEEDILEIKWLAPSEWKNILDNIFPSIKDVLHASGKM